MPSFDKETIQAVEKWKISSYRVQTRRKFMFKLIKRRNRYVRKGIGKEHDTYNYRKAIIYFMMNY